MTPDYIWRKLGSESILRTPYYAIQRDRLRHPRGHELDYYVIEHVRQAVGVVPVREIDGTAHVLLVQQWRHPVQKLAWAIPAGAIETGEAPEAAARRELREEAACEAGIVRPLYQYHPSIGLSNQNFHLFIADDVKGAGVADDNEIHAVRWFSRSEIEGMLGRNEIIDGMSLVALLIWMRSL